MPNLNGMTEQGIRERAYYIWEREGRPKGKAADHWARAIIEDQRLHADDALPDEEKILAGRADVNFPALLTRDVPGG